MATSTTGDDSSAKTSSMIAALQKYGYDLADPLLPSPAAPEATSPTSVEMLPAPATSADAPTKPSPVTRVSSASSILQLRERKNDQTALHIAAKKAHLDVLRALGALPRASEFVNIGDRHGNTALHFAASATKDARIAVEMVEVLLAMGANVQARNARGQTPLMTHILTRKDDDPSVTQCLVHHDQIALNEMVNDTTYLHVAIENNLVEIACALVAGGASINMPDSKGVVIADTIPRKTLVRLICVMKDGTQCAPESSDRTCCKLCNAHRGLLEKFKDCKRCGRVVCKACSAKASEVKHATEHDTRVMKPRDKPKDKDKDKSDRICKVCSTVILLQDKKHRAKEDFNEKLYGCGMK